MMKKIELEEGGEFPVNSVDKQLLNEFKKNYTQKDDEKLFYEIIESKHDNASDVCRLNPYVVGLIKTSSTIATINPRHFDYRSIMRMWTYVHFDNFANMKTSQGFKSGGQIDDLVKYMLLMYRKYLTDCIKRKLPMKYREEFGWEGSMRGRLDPMLYQLQPVKQKFPVHVDKLTSNFVANQYLKCAWEKCERVLSTIDEGFEIADFLIIENEMVGIEGNLEFNPYSVQQALDFAAGQDSHYADTMRLAHMINQNLIVNDVGGNDFGFTFLINYNVLFEDYVFRVTYNKFYDYGTSKESFEFIASPSGGSLDSKNSSTFEPDVIIGKKNLSTNHYESLAVLDAKNKVGDKVAYNPDLFQIFTYGKLLNAKYAILVYPSKLNKKPEEFQFSLNKHKVLRWQNAVLESKNPMICYLLYLNVQSDNQKEAIEYFQKQLELLLIE